MRTDAGQPVATTVKCRKKSACKVIAKRNGKVVLKTFGAKRFRVVVRQSAPAADGYAAYSATTRYKNGERR